MNYVCKQDYQLFKKNMNIGNYYGKRITKILTELKKNDRGHLSNNSVQWEWIFPLQLKPYGITEKKVQKKKIWTINS